MFTNEVDPISSRLIQHRGLIFGVMIITALLSFEIFNYSTTDYALSDLLGGLEFLGIRWATILAIAFCGIDFAGIARLFTPEQGADEPAEVWYLFGAWLLAATMNAMLTWWGVSLAVLNHETLGNAIIERSTLLRMVPIFIAVMVWLIRVLIIGTFSVAGERLFTQAERRQLGRLGRARLGNNPVVSPQPAIHRPSAATAAFSPAPKPNQAVRSAPSFRSNQGSSPNPGEASEGRAERMF
jgi:hypothetical protein